MSIYLYSGQPDILEKIYHVNISIFWSTRYIGEDISCQYIYILVNQLEKIYHVYISDSGQPVGEDISCQYI